MNDKIKYWVELSDYDYETALAMYSSGRYLYVGFMCHQAIEKILKAFFCKQFKESVPYTHNLSYLATKSNIYHEFSEGQRNFIDILEPLNIEARYPSYKEKLMKSFTKERCENILNNTQELQQWIKQKLFQS